MNTEQARSIPDRIKNLYRMENLDGLMDLVRDTSLDVMQRMNAVSHIVHLADHPGACAAADELEVLARDSSNAEFRINVGEWSVALRQVMGRSRDVDFLLALARTISDGNHLAATISSLLEAIPGADKRTDVKQWLDMFKIGDSLGTGTAVADTVGLPEFHTEVLRDLYKNN